MNWPVAALNRAILELSERLGVELVVSTKKTQPTASVAEAHSVPPPPKHLGRERRKPRGTGTVSPPTASPGPNAARRHETAEEEGEVTISRALRTPPRSEHAQRATCLFVARFQLERYREPVV